MALLKCPECNNDVSSTAKICPKCGCPVKKEIEKIATKKFMEENPLTTIFLSIFTIAGVIIGIFGGIFGIIGGGLLGMLVGGGIGKILDVSFGKELNKQLLRIDKKTEWKGALIFFLIFLLIMAVVLIYIFTI